jgi:prevent-host-death family protein
MITVTVAEAKEKLEELIAKAQAGESVEIISNGNKALLSPITVASVVVGSRIGSQKGALIYMSDDFNEPLDDFKEYLQ